MAEKDTDLLEIPPDLIEQNPDNPRLIFREKEMQALQDSIAEVGIQVPISVYRKGTKRFVLVDGERRWRCARKLNMPEIPALVQPKPGRLENILTMFNIHNVRLDWDLMPMALKLDEVRGMLEKEGRLSSPRDLAGLTGVPLPTVRRALELLTLPKKYQELLLKEAEKPREEQTITADLFVEINKSKSAIRRYVPEVFESVSERDFVDAMVEKYRSGLAKSVTEFREVSRIARAERAGEDPEEVEPVLIKLVKDPKLSIERAYEATVRDAYESRDLETRLTGLMEKLNAISDGANLPESVMEKLRSLREQIDRILPDD